MGARRKHKCPLCEKLCGWTQIRLHLYSHVIQQFLTDDFEAGHPEHNARTRDMIELAHNFTAKVFEEDEADYRARKETRRGN